MANFLYNPDRKGKEQLKAEFVVRTKILNDIMRDIETSTMKLPEQHYLLVGQRGTGKTTMLLRIRYAIEDSKKLNSWLIPINFSEEQYNVSELANLWENVAHYLEDYHGFKGIGDEMEKEVGKNNFEELCYEILAKHLKEHKKKVVLLIDNIGDLFKKMEQREIYRLREILQTRSEFRLIAGSPLYLESILDYKQPLFEFFKVVRLDGLNKEETQALLLKLGELYNEKEKIQRIIKETPGRIETLRILTSGVPRTIALMFNIFVDYEHENSIKDLERVLDAVTPLYKHRMDDLPKQQQKIVDAVARNWEAISVKELKEKVRLESKVISAQLRQLEKDQIIEKRETNTKNHLYLLQERFFNIWYLMRYGRKEKQDSVKWLVSFMESWYDESELDMRIEKFVDKIVESNINTESASFYSDVYKSINCLSDKARAKLNFGIRIWENSKIDDENELELRNLLISENPKDIVTKIFEINFLSNDMKQDIANYIINQRFSGERKMNELFDKIMSEKFDSIINDRKNESNALYVLFFVVQVECFLRILQSVISGRFDAVDKIMMPQVEFIHTILNEFGHSFYKKHFSIEDFLFQHEMMQILASGQIESLIVFFEQKKDLGIQEIYKPIYYASLVLKDKSIFATLGDEIKEPVRSVLAKVEEFRKTLNEFKTKSKS